MIEVPDNFLEDFAVMKSQVGDIHRAWNNGGSPAAKRLSTRVDGLFLCASIVTLGYCGWLGWLTLAVQKYCNGG